MTYFFLTLNWREFNIPGGLSQEESLHRLQFLSSLVGCGPMLEQESSHEDRRKQIALLCQVFAPRETCELQQSPSFFECSVEHLQETVLRAAPHMEKYFRKYLNDSSRMRKIATSPTTNHWSIVKLHEKLRKAGAVGLFIGSSGNPVNLIRKLQDGLLCSQARFEEGRLSITGASAEQDHVEGGAGAVFTRMITKEMLDQKSVKFVMEDIPYSGYVQVLVDLSALNTGGYAYPQDKWGSKKPKDYTKRSSFLELVPQLNPNESLGNEWMIPRRIPPEKVLGILVKNEKMKKGLIEVFVKEGLTTEKRGELYLTAFPSIPLDKFIRTGSMFTKDMWS